ncbi:hypothetical protein IRT38_04565 [Acinetobacter sp. SK-43]|uniref:hypothetical protein n=1 Tax=Acinetobacter sp. SK-43 TaxID=2785295 RepID=UPI00188BE72D|nr:hypothetical protein [Acinetobacter sp. SK-43]MBF4454670.1 hypothetical protein [Acinetobacter sp. SK-43]
MKKISQILPLLMILVVIFFIYKQVLHFDYLWDDDLLIVDNVDLINSKLNWDILARPVLPGSSYFRPLVFLSWFIEFKLFGQSAAISHLVNLGLFLCNISLVYWLAYLLGKAKQKKNLVLLASFCAGLYAIHPIHVETTAWVSGRFDLMVTLFTLLTCILFISQYLKNKLNLFINFLIGLCYFFTLMSKELGLVVPILIFILYCAVSSDGFRVGFISFFKKYYTLFGFIGVFFIIYYMLRLSSMQETYHYPFTWEYYKTIVFEQQIPLYAIKQYFLQALLPFYTLGPIQPTELFTVRNLINIISIILIAIFLIYLTINAVKRNSFFAWMMLSYLVTISLVIFLIPISSGNNIIQERFMTLGLTFFVIGIVFTLSELGKKSWKILAITILLIWSIGAYVTTKSIIPFWKNEMTLWSWVHRIYPELATIRNLYYFSLLKYNHLDELISILDKEVISKGKALHVADQILYAKALLIKRNPESIEYLKGVISYIPEFHKMYPRISIDILSKAAAPYELTAMQIATVYDSLSIATLWFENNPELALQYSYIAEKYLEPSEKYPVFYNRIAFLKILGREQEAENLSKQISKIAMYRKDDNIQNVGKIIKIWCEINNMQEKCEN